MKLASLTIALAAVLLAANAGTDHRSPPLECVVSNCRDFPHCDHWCDELWTGGSESVADVTVDNQYTIVNNTTTPAVTYADVSYAAGDLLYACGGTATLSVMAANGSDDLECSSTSILYRVPGELGPLRLDKECDWDERETFTFSGSGNGVTAQRSCSAADPT